MHTDLRQDYHLIAERGIYSEHTLILGDGLIEAMTPFRIGHIDFRPRWCKENLLVIAMRCSEGCQRRLTCQVLEGSSGIKQAPIKEYPAGFTTRSSAVSKGNLDTTSRESGLAYPRQCQSRAEHLFLHDPSARLLHRGVTALAEFDQQR